MIIFILEKRKAQKKSCVKSSPNYLKPSPPQKKKGEKKEKKKQRER